MNRQTRADIAGFYPEMACNCATLADIPDHCECSRHNWICWMKKSPPTITATPAAAMPAVRKRPDEYFVANCSISVRLGGKNSTRGDCPASKRAAQTERRRHRSLGRKRHAELIRRVGRNHFDLQMHRFETQFHFVRELMRQFGGPKNADVFHHGAQFGRQLAEGDARFARDETGMQHGASAFAFNRAGERAQCRHPPPQVIWSDTELPPITSASTP